MATVFAFVSPPAGCSLEGAGSIEEQKFGMPVFPINGKHGITKTVENSSVQGFGLGEKRAGHSYKLC